jgi:hypothetical protein
MTFSRSNGQEILLRIGRCNSDKTHFNQIIKSKVRMNRMNRKTGKRLMN